MKTNIFMDFKGQDEDIVGRPLFGLPERGRKMPEINYQIYHF